MRIRKYLLPFALFEKEETGYTTLDKQIIKRHRVQRAKDIKSLKFEILLVLLIMKAFNFGWILANLKKVLLKCVCSSYNFVYVYLCFSIKFYTLNLESLKQQHLQFKHHYFRI